MILDNLKLYFKIYVPKYASAFNNSKITTGNLQIGVNDYNEITGIPYLGTLKLKTIRKMIENVKTLISEDVKIEVEVENLQINHNLLEDTSKSFIEKTNKRNYIHKMINENYYKERAIWTKEVLKYGVKLSTIIQDTYTREKFYKWIKLQNCSILNECLTIQPEDIEKIKNKIKLVTNKNNVIHWIAKFKDKSMKEIQNMKPEAPNITKYINGSVHLITNLTDLQYKFINSNKNMKYYKINIKFPELKENEISYLRYNKKKLYKSYRREKEDGPYSVTIS